MRPIDGTMLVFQRGNGGWELVEQAFAGRPLGELLREYQQQDVLVHFQIYDDRMLLCGTEATAAEFEAMSKEILVIADMLQALESMESPALQLPLPPQPEGLP